MNRAAQMEDYRHTLEKYDEILKQFEEWYAMDSAYLYEEFEAGRMGDSDDFFEWTGIYELRQYVLEQMVQVGSV